MSRFWEEWLKDSNWNLAKNMIQTFDHDLNTINMISVRGKYSPLRIYFCWRMYSNLQVCDIKFQKSMSLWMFKTIHLHPKSPQDIDVNTRTIEIPQWSPLLNITTLLRFTMHTLSYYVQFLSKVFCFGVLLFLKSQGMSVSWAASLWYVY